MTVAIIPAKGRSSRIPRKNLRPLAGKPLLQWTVEAAIDAKQPAGIDQVIVSTEDIAVHRLAHRLGVESCEHPDLDCKPEPQVPDVVMDAVRWMEGRGDAPSTVVVLLPTSPFRTAEHITDAVAVHRGSEGRNVLSVVRRRTHRDLVAIRDEGGQERLAPLCDHNGAILIALKETLWKSRGWVRADQAVPYWMDPDEGMDINTEEDWMRAERLAEVRFQREWVS